MGLAFRWRKVRKSPLNILEISSAGAGFIYPLCGEMRTMPGLGSAPGGANIDIDADGNVVGLF